VLPWLRDDLGFEMTGFVEARIAMKAMGVMLLTAATCMLGCSAETPIAHNHETPEGAVLKLEDAYRAIDINAAVECRAFEREAELMFKASELAKKLEDKGSDKKTPDEKGTAEKDPDEKKTEGGAVFDHSKVIAQLAGIREFNFRLHLQQKGFPNMQGVTSTFADKKVDEDGIVTLTEISKFPDGHTTTKQVKAVKTTKGWKVFEPPE
jgi:hypothetical protein